MINLTQRAREKEREREQGGLGKSKESRLKGATGTEMQSKTGVKNGCVSAAAAAFLVRSNGHMVQGKQLYFFTCHVEARRAWQAGRREGVGVAMAIIIEEA
jgi:hypothetical protein